MTDHQPDVGSGDLIECVLNVSEGRDAKVLDRLREAAGSELLDVHTDPHHNRSVLTLVGVSAPRRVATAATDLDITSHRGVHPRLGIIDVVPFVSLGGDLDRAIEARNQFASWMASDLGVPCFLYGPERTLPDVRRSAFTDLAPDVGPAQPHSRLGATAVGARAVLVAYNVWLAEPDIRAARAVARAVRGPSVRALGLQVGDRAQVSMNLIDPHKVGPEAAFDLVREAGESMGATPVGGELVGLVPEAVLDKIDPARWDELDLAADRTVEARLAAAGF